MYSNVVTAIDKILRSYYVSTVANSPAIVLAYTFYKRLFELGMAGTGERHSA